MSRLPALPALTLTRRTKRVALALAVPGALVAAVGAYGGYSERFAHTRRGLWFGIFYVPRERESLKYQLLKGVGAGGGAVLGGGAATAAGYRLFATRLGFGGEEHIRIRAVDPFSNSVLLILQRILL